MSDKFTKGPWSVKTDVNGNVGIKAENGDRVAVVCEYGEQSETPSAQKHNARLIAAAPIGYELAMEVMRQHSVVGAVPESVAKLAADFLSKAKGA